MFLLISKVSVPILSTPGQVMRPNKKDKCVLVNGSEIFRYMFFCYFFSLEKNIILCILKGILPFKMHKIIFFFQKT